MTEEMRLRFKIASVLLQFPDEGFPAYLDAIEEAAGRLPSEEPRRIFEEAVGSMRSMALIELQEAYTRVFDLSPATSLDLTSHRWGNDKKRSDILIWLKAVYTDTGYESASMEIPDFLPMILEFLAVAPAEACSVVIGRLGDEIRALASRLSETGSVYAPILEALEGAVPVSSS